MALERLMREKLSPKKLFCVKKLATADVDRSFAPREKGLLRFWVLRICRGFCKTHRSFKVPHELGQNIMKHCLKSDTLLASSRVNSAPIHTWHSSADSSTILEKRSTKKWAAHDVLSKEILENTASHGKSPTLRGLTTTPFPKKQSKRISFKQPMLFCRSPRRTPNR